MRLCGISSRFQLLSPCVRQVIHALLTRPPLSHRTIIPEGNQVKCFVRLACVKHAASVHPEPGSNSHKKFFPFQDQLANFNHSSILNVLLFFRLLWLSSLLFSRTHFNANCFAVLNESFKVISLFSYQSSLLLFKRQLLYFIKSICLCQQLFYFSLLSFQATAILDYHSIASLSTTFSFHPEVFQEWLSHPMPSVVLTFLLSAPPHQRQLAYNSTTAGRSQHILAAFSKVGHLLFFIVIAWIVQIICTILLYTTCT